jgi:hypothetical protein
MEPRRYISLAFWAEDRRPDNGEEGAKVIHETGYVSLASWAAERGRLLTLENAAEAPDAPVALEALESSVRLRAA